MVALRDFGWPHMIVRGHPEPSSVPASPIMQSSSVRDSIQQAELVDQICFQRSTEGDWPRTTATFFLIPLCTELHLQVSDPPSRPATTGIIHLCQGQCAEKQGFPSDVWEGLDEECTEALTVPFTTGRDVFEMSTKQTSHYTESPLHFDLRKSSISIAGVSATDDLQLFTQLRSPELTSSLSLALDGSPSHSTSVFELTQDKSEFPIGGLKVASIASDRSSDAQTITTQDGQLPCIEITRPQTPVCCGLHENPKLRQQYKTPSLSDDRTGIESRPMVAHPGMPQDERKSDGSDAPYLPKYAAIVESGAKDFAQSYNGSTDSGAACTITNAKSTPEITEKRGQTFPSALGGNPLVIPTASTSDIQNAAAVPEASKQQETTALSDVPRTNVVTYDFRPEHVPWVPAPPLEQSRNMTEQISTPQLSGNRAKTSKRVTAKGQKVIRKARSKMLVKPILVCIIGRQLAAPTCMALKSISYGMPIIPTDVNQAP